MFSSIPQRLPGRTAHERGGAQGAESTGSLARAPTSVPGGGGILAARTAADMPSWACTVVRNHARMHLGARWSAACQGAVPPAGNMRGAPSRAASSEGAGARCGGDAATATRSLDIATESSGMRRQGIIGRARRQQTGSPGLGAPGTTTNQPTGAYGGGGGFR